MHKIKPSFWLVVPLLTLVMLMLSIIPAQAQVYDVYMAYQTYDEGFMVWRSDSGQIYAFNNNTQVTVVPVASYGHLPDNPVQEATPPNRIRPVRGFGKVWGNFPAIRNALGWATSNEQGFTSNFAVVDRLRVTFTLPDGARVLITGNESWSFTDYSPQPQPSATSTPSPMYPPHIELIPSTYQYFEGGLMMWWSTSGTVWVLVDNGRAYHYAPNLYGVLPDNPFFNPPDGYVRPIMGFGKVWGNYATIRSLLGWATTFERSYTTTLERVSSIGSAVNLIITDPDGRSIVVRDNGTWYYP